MLRMFCVGLIGVCLCGCGFFAPSDPVDECVDACEENCDAKPGSCEPSSDLYCQQVCAGSGSKNENDPDDGWGE